MILTSQTFSDGSPIPARCAFCELDAETHVRLAGNRNPELAWDGAPAGTKSFVITCVDGDVPTVGDDVNQEGRSVPADLPRTEFLHWALIDVPATVNRIEEAACSDGVVAGGKVDPPGPSGARQGVNDYTGWFSGDPDMGGSYRGYDGPGPPWNDERLHHYRFEVHAMSVSRLDLEGDFGLGELRSAMGDHVLASASITGTYTTNPSLA